MNFDFGEIFGQKMRNFRLDFIMIIKIQIGKVYYKKKGQFPEFCPSLFLLPKIAICQKVNIFAKNSTILLQNVCKFTFWREFYYIIDIVYKFVCIQKI